MEYAVSQGIDNDPSCNWWVVHVLRKRDRIISAVKHRNARYLKRTHNFGIEVPKTVAEVIILDENNGDTHWQEEIAKEIKRSCEASA